MWPPKITTKKSGEQLLPEEKTTTEPQIDAQIVSQLEIMGFPNVRCKKAAIATQNSGAEPALQALFSCFFLTFFLLFLQWLMEHMDDPDIDAPIQAQQPKSTSSSKSEPSPEMISSLAEMGMLLLFSWLLIDFCVFFGVLVINRLYCCSSEICS